MTKFKNISGLETEKLNKEIEKQCGPIIEQILFDQFPDKTPEERGQIAYYDNMIGGLMSGYWLERDADELAKAALPDKKNK